MSITTLPSTIFRPKGRDNPVLERKPLRRFVQDLEGEHFGADIAQPRCKRSPEYRFPSDFFIESRRLLRYVSYFDIIACYKRWQL
jgi:hypothetical protein